MRKGETCVVLYFVDVAVIVVSVKFSRTYRCTFSSMIIFTVFVILISVVITLFVATITFPFF